MKKKVLGLTIAGIVALSGVVSATSMWGTYKGNEIVRLKIDDKPILVSAGDVPAISYQGRTMVPLNLLKYAGLTYSWDQKSKTVSIGTGTASAATDVQGLGKALKAYGVTHVYVEYNVAGSYESTSVVYKGDSDTISVDQLTNILAIGSTTDSKFFDIYFNNGDSYTFSGYDLDSWAEGSLTGDQLMNSAQISSGSATTGTSTSNSNSSSATTIEKTYPSLYSNDLKTYLGKLSTNKYDADSIFNEYGTYGSKYQTKSIWNEYGTYGSDYSAQSAFNSYATKPPAIVLNGKVMGYLTTNTTFDGAISPAGLYEFLVSLGY